MKQLPKPEKNLKNFILGEDAKIIDKTMTKVALTSAFIGFAVVESMQDANAQGHSNHSNHHNNILMDGNGWSTDSPTYTVKTPAGFDLDGDPISATNYETYVSRSPYVVNDGGNFWLDSTGNYINNFTTTTPNTISPNLPATINPGTPVPSNYIGDLYSRIIESKLVSNTSGDTPVYYDDNMANNNDIVYTKTTGIAKIGDIEITAKSVQTNHGNHYNHSNDGGNWYNPF